MKKISKLSKTLSGGATLAILLGGISGPLSGQTVLFSESFETDGLNTRYSVENLSDDEGSDFFNRRQQRSTGVRVAGGTIDGDWLWAAQDLDADGAQVNDLEADEGRITFINPVNISGFGDLTISMAAGSGGNELEFDNVLFLQYRIDGGAWINAGGFRGTYTDSPARYFEGDERVLPSNDNARLNRTMADFSWKLFSTGSQLELRVMINSNGGTEEYGFDNIRVTGDNALGTLGISASKTTFSESEGANAGQINFALSTPAPTGGLTVHIHDSDTNNSEFDLPAEIVIPEGTSSYAMNLDVIADGRFDGSEVVFIYFEAAGYARDVTVLEVSNIDNKPNVFINEIYPTPIQDDLSTDTNGDGVADTQQDEFIEFVNGESFAVDLSGWSINDDLGPRHIFPEGSVLAPGQATVVFGAGEAVGLFGGALVMKASTGNLAPSTADTMSLLAGSAMVDTITFEGELGNTSRSIVRAVDLDSTTEWVDIQTLTGEGGLKFTPGIRNDGTPIQGFANTLEMELSATTAIEGTGAVAGTVRLVNAGSVQVTLSAEGENGDEIIIEPSVLTVTEVGVNFTVTPVSDRVLDGDQTVRITARAEGMMFDAERFTVEDRDVDVYDVVINEVFAGIFGTAADVNGNGLVEELVEDLYIEIVNNSADAVNLADWVLYSYTEENRRGSEIAHIFPAQTVLAPGGSIVVIGGGDEAQMNASSDTLFGGAIVQVANQGGNGINLPDDNVGIVYLTTPYGYVEDRIRYESSYANQSQALTRSPDSTGDFPSLHFEVSSAFELYSAGRMLDGTAFAGNGAGTPEALQYYVRGSILTNDGYLVDDWFGWFYTGKWPYVYSYTTGSWRYVRGGSSDGNGMIMYDYELSRWIFTNYVYYQWYYDYNEKNWIQL